MRPVIVFLTALACTTLTIPAQAKSTAKNQTKTKIKAKTKKKTKHVQETPPRPRTYPHGTYSPATLDTFLLDTLQPLYLDLSERSAFPYLAEHLESQPSKTRSQAETDAQDASGGKELLEDLTENQLSHLLGWMVCATPSTVRGMAVYDTNGVLQGFSSDVYTNKTTKNLLTYDQLTTLFPLLLDQERVKKMDDDVRHRCQPQTFPHIEQVSHKDFGRFVIVAEGIYHPGTDTLLGYLLFLMDPQS